MSALWRDPHVRIPQMPANRVLRRGLAGETIRRRSSPLSAIDRNFTTMAARVSSEWRRPARPT